MMNPLQAMAMARQANQMGGLGVQSQGAQQMAPLLQQAQMNVASPLKMEAQPARLMEMDKYKYVNAAQDRAQRDKQLLFNALDAKEARAHREALQAQAYQNALNLEDIKQKNVMDAQDRAKRIELETNKQKLQFELEEKKRQAEILQGLNDERYAGLRKPLANVFAKYNRWNGDGAGSKLETRQRLFKERIERAAFSTVTEEEVQAYYQANVQGFVPGTKIDKKSQAYRDNIINIFRANHAGTAEDILQGVDEEVRGLDQQITIAYNRSLAELPKLGISLPEADPYVAPTPNQNPLTITNPSVLPSKVGSAGGPNGNGNPNGNPNPSSPTQIGTAGKTAIAITAGSSPYTIPKIIDTIGNEAKVDSMKNKLDAGEFSKKYGNPKLTGAALQNRRYQMFKDFSKGTDVPSLTKKQVAGMSNVELSRHINKVQEGIASKIVKKLPKALTGKLGKGSLALVLGGGVFAYLNAMTPEDRAEVQGMIQQVEQLQAEKQLLDSNFDYNGSQYQINF